MMQYDIFYCSIYYYFYFILPVASPRLGSPSRCRAGAPWPGRQPAAAQQQRAEALALGEGRAGSAGRGVGRSSAPPAPTCIPPRCSSLCSIRSSCWPGSAGSQQGRCNCGRVKTIVINMFMIFVFLLIRYKTPTLHSPGSLSWQFCPPALGLLL